MNYLILFLEIFYLIILIMVCLRIIYDTTDSTKAVAYLGLVVLLPIVGIIFYFSVGVNYRKNKLYDKKLISNNKLQIELEQNIVQRTQKIKSSHVDLVSKSKKLINMLLTDSQSPLSSDNSVELLINGEEKFPSLIEALKSATSHIHLEYYIYEDDDTGRMIEEVLKQKAQEGVKVRFMYDDFGSKSIRKKLVPRLNAAGVETSPFFEIKLMAFANRLNYRNHRKIVIVDGHTAYVGGINVSNEYSNYPDYKNKVYWRDSHVKIVGSAVHHLQYLFLGDWNFCSGASLEINSKYFPQIPEDESRDKLIQMAASGPDSDTPSIHNSMLQAINQASEEINITTPYFIPTDSIMKALCICSSGGVKVRLLVPGVSDSALVAAASSSYYSQLMESGVEIYRYQKGFVHAKTLVVDDQLSMIGTANMDIRSFDLNFEVNAIIYDKEIAEKMKSQFEKDLVNATLVIPEKWAKRSWFTQLWENLARLLSPVL